MTKYKIVKKFYFSGVRFFVYKKWFFGLLWKRVEICTTQQEAERNVSYRKQIDEAKAKKPEVIGYY